jgi:hypothetical protein
MASRYYLAHLEGSARDLLRLIAKRRVGQRPGRPRGPRQGCGVGVYRCRNASLRAQLTPAHRGKGSEVTSGTASASDRTPEEKRRAMSWAQRFKRVLGINVSACIQ